MCTGRLQKRVPSAEALFGASLNERSLRFHKRSVDGSGKCDAYLTHQPVDVVWGVVFRFLSQERERLDRAEGLGSGYDEEEISVIDLHGEEHETLVYVADPESIDKSLSPYSWYKRFLVEGARQHRLPLDYIEAVEAVQTLDDPNETRDRTMRSIKC